jgi:Transposase DDE domain
VIDHITDALPHSTRVLQVQSQVLMGGLKKAMWRFGRQCRGQGRVFVKVVRQTERHLLTLGQPLVKWAEQAQGCLQNATAISPAKRERLTSQLQSALAHHQPIEAQSRQLTPGKRLAHRKIVSAYDDTIAPIIKGKSNCPTQFGRKPGLLSEPTMGFIFAVHLPEGNPDDARYVEPLVDRTQIAIDRLRSARQLAIHSVGGDMGLNDAKVHQFLHERGSLTVGIAKSINPINATPDAEEIAAILAESGLAGKRTAHQVKLASACGYSRPVVESHIATLESRGAGHLRYRGSHGARVQLGMTVIAHNGAALARLSQRPLSNRAQTFRQKLRLKRPKASKIKR